MEKLESSYTAVKMYNGANSMTVIQRVKYRPSKSLIGIRLSKGNENMYIHTKTHVQIFIVTLYIIAKKYKEPKALSTNEQINKM